MVDRAKRLVAGVLVLLVPTNALAWGPDGHKAVVRVAEKRLSPEAKAQVAVLLGSQTMLDIATWADDVRNTTHKNTYNWHFSDVPTTAAAFKRSRDCKPNAEKGDCSVAALERLTAVLQDHTRPQAERREALMFIIHIVGDVHQPLHSAERNHDRGGNDVTIAAIGGSRNLHSAWDSGIINASGKNETSLASDAETWLATQNETSLALGSFIDWTNESHDIARDIAYAQAADQRITSAERAEAIRIIEKRIARAGVRLADVLNRAFADGDSE